MPLRQSLRRALAFIACEIMYKLQESTMSFALLIFLYRASGVPSHPLPAADFAFSISLISKLQKSQLTIPQPSFIFMEPSLHLLYSLYARDTFSFAGRIFFFSICIQDCKLLIYYRNWRCSCCPWMYPRRTAAAFIWPTVLVSPLILLMLLPSMIFLDRSTCHLRTDIHCFSIKYPINSRFLPEKQLHKCIGCIFPYHIF